MIKTTKSQIFSLALVSMFAASCGRPKSAPAAGAQTPAPLTPAGPIAPQGPANGQTAQLDKLAVEIVNFDAINGKSITNGTKIEFRLKNSQPSTAGIQFKCVIWDARATGVEPTDICTSPKTIESLPDGQYKMKIVAVEATSGKTENPTIVSFSIGAAQGGQGGGPVVGPGGSGARPVMEQVGDLFLVTVPQGMHKVYSASTFEQPGFVKFRMIDASMRDTAAPYPLACRPGASFEQLVLDVSPAGAQLNYCEQTPPILMNAPADPFYNTFRWSNMNTMSYNSLAIASDSSLGGVAPGAPPQTLAKMFINVFTNPNQNHNGFQAPFATELNQTASRLQLSCGSQNIQYLGDAVTNQGYYSWSVAVAPLFGCVNPRGGRWYVDIAAFPLEHVTSLLPSIGWNGWISQGFASQRAAEIVVEIGPFDYAPLPMSVSRQAQELMSQHIRKLTY